MEFLAKGPDENVSDHLADDIEIRRILPETGLRPKAVVISLPLNLGPTKCKEFGIAWLIPQEITLHEGQANNVLHAIRVYIANKSVLFRTMVWPAKSQSTTTRAWVQVHLVEQVINLNSMLYKKCQLQL